MVTLEEIQIVCNKIAEKFRPEKIILFGSQAHGQPTENSDVDLLIIMDYAGKRIDLGVEMRMTVDFPFAVDLIIRQPADAARRYQEYDPIIREAFDHGKVIYDRNNERVA